MLNYACTTFKTLILMYSTAFICSTVATSISGVLLYPLLYLHYNVYLIKEMISPPTNSLAIKKG